MSGRIHETAIVDPSAVVADGVSIGPFSILEAGVEIGVGRRHPFLDHCVNDFFQRWDFHPQ